MSFAVSSCFLSRRRRLPLAAVFKDLFRVLRHCYPVQGDRGRLHHPSRGPAPVFLTCSLFLPLRSLAAGLVGLRHLLATCCPEYSPAEYRHNPRRHRLTWVASRPGRWDLT